MKYTALSLMLLLLFLAAGLLLGVTGRPVSGQTITPTLDPLFQRATELIKHATQTAVAGGDFANSVGTSTPLAGLCNSLTYRRLEDIEAALMAQLEEFEAVEVEVLLHEETQDCVTFSARETLLTLQIEVADLSDEESLGDALGNVLRVIGSTAIETLPTPRLSLRFHLGNQQRLWELAYAEALIPLNDEQSGEALLDALTWAGN